ncbi:hypothetical protein BH11BAC4_BH11BAC4_24290 [soil metagenome]
MQEAAYSITTDNPLNEKNFHLLKSSLYNSSGLSYTDFKKTLKPVYSKVWIDIFLGWAGIFIVLITAGFLLQSGDILFSIIVSLTAATLIGYFIAYLINFFHEAAHYNITAGKRTNDRLANLLLGILVGQGIKNYRLVHWQHHVALGTTADTERSYFESLDLRFFIYALTGISALQLLLKRSEFVKANSKEPAAVLSKEKYIQLFISLAFHAGLLTLLFLFGQYWLMAVWILATGSFYPFFNRLRQLIEHRSDKADKKINYANMPHGKLSRIFGNSILDRSFGSAGFNKHLLHHLEPTISYTRMNELEAFLTETLLGEHIKKQRSSYFGIFKKLLNR